MIRFRVEVYSRHKLESGEYGRCLVREFYLSITSEGYIPSTKESYTPITNQDHSVALQVCQEYTTILTERFFFRHFTEYRVTLES